MATIDLGKLGFVNKGTYNSSTSYEKNDLVQYTDSSILSTYLYINAAAATGQTPSTSGTVNGTYWAYYAKGGAAGADGTNVATTLTTQGDILYRDGSGLQRLPKGTAGQVLKMNSSANAPEYGTLSSDFVKLATVNVSSGVSTVAIDGNGSWADNTVYSSYFFNVKQLSTSNDSGSSVVQLRINFAGSAYSSSNYYAVTNNADANSSSASDGSGRVWGGTQFGLSFNNMDAENGRSGYGSIELINTGGDENGGSGSYYPNIKTDFLSHHSNSSTIYQYLQMGYVANNAPLSGITLIPTGGNIDNGIITVYGRKK